MSNITLSCSFSGISVKDYQVLYNTKEVLNFRERLTNDNYSEHIKGQVIAFDSVYDVYTSHAEHYFEDWKSPTEEELIAFCLEYDINF